MSEVEENLVKGYEALLLGVEKENESLLIFAKPK